MNRIRLFLFFGLAGTACVLFTTMRTASAQTKYLPLAIGNRWELVSGGQRMTVEVTDQQGSAFVVRWTNPFVNSTFHFEQRGDQVLLTALDMGGGPATFSNTVYFDFALPQGRQWDNALGTLAISNKGRTLSTPAGTFDDVVEIRLTDKKGAQTFWTFAPNVGFVQFGQGKTAFQLQTFTARNERNSGSRPAAITAPLPKAKSTSRILIGLDSNPTATEGYGDQAKLNRARMAVEAGVSLMYIHPKWTEVESPAGKLSFTEVDFQTRLAEQHNLPVYVNLRVIDTSQRAIPGPYASWKFSDPRMSDKLKAILRALAPRLKGRVQWVAIGNESDGYFNTHKNEIADYATLIRNVMGTVRELFPGAAFSVNFTHNAVGQLEQLYSPLVSQMGFYSFTYYPLNPDFTFRDPSVVFADIDAMVSAAKGKPVLFQEFGYPSSGAVSSSEDKQASFVENVFASLRRHRDQIIGANFVWMSDLPESVVNDLGSYYKLSNSDKFKAFLGSLGYWDRSGRPKKAWQTFQREAAGM